MNDFRNRLHAAAGTTAVPDTHNLWVRGRRAARRRTALVGVAAVVMLAGIGVVVGLAATDDQQVDVRDDPTVTTSTSLSSVVPDEPLPVIDVPEGTTLTAYPFALDGWDIQVDSQAENLERSNTLSLHRTNGEFALVTFADPEPGTTPVALKWDESRFTSDLGFDESVQTVVGWDGPAHTGSIVVVGDTDPKDLALALFDSPLFIGPDGAPPAGWSAGIDTRSTTGGGIVSAWPPGEGQPAPRLSTLLFDEPPSAADFSSFGDFAPPAIERSVMGHTAYQWNDFVVWNDDLSLHIVFYERGGDPVILDAFLEALEPVTSVDTIPASTAGPDIAPGTTVQPNAVGSDSIDGPTVQDHWHIGFAIIECGEVWPTILNEHDPDGIHTHGDGLIHIHPFNESTTGTGATLEQFLDAIDYSFGPDALLSEGPSGNWHALDCDGQPSETRLIRGHRDRADTTTIAGDAIFSEYFQENGETWVLARVPITSDNTGLELPVEVQAELNGHVPLFDSDN
jgi:hypothetical protein